MASPLWPHPDYKLRYSLKKGYVGHDVAALQLNLERVGYTLSLNGDFTDETKSVVRQFQMFRSLDPDGIAGPITQRHLAFQLIRPPESEFTIPLGIFRGLVEGESGWMVGAVNFNSVGGVDCGWVQRRILEKDYSDQAFENAFDGQHQFYITARALRVQKNEFYDRLLKASQESDHVSVTHRRAWELAILYHNWKAAANAFADGDLNWTYYETINGQKVERTMDEPAQWVIKIGVPGVYTGFDWCEFYINTKTQYVKHFGR